MESETKQVKKAVVIYHDNCMDGFASAWAFHHLKEKDYPEGVVYIPESYGGENHNRQELIGYDLFIVDFSFDRAEINKLAVFANKIVILDHHKTALTELAYGWEDKPDNVTIVFDMERSGAGITWDYFATQQDLKHNERPSLINYVEDRDLWKFKLHMSKEVNAVIAVTPKDFKSYNNLSIDISHHLDLVTQTGVYLTLQHQQICESIVKDAREIAIEFDGIDGGEIHYGLAANCTGQFASEVGNLLALKSKGFGATYFSAADGSVKWSLRSTGTYDVSRICKAFGGGGHKNASGFVVQLNLEEGVDPSRIVLRQVK